MDKMAKLLVVEDDPRIRAVLVRQLTGCGYVCADVGSGEEALAAVALDLPQAVILDIDLPGIDGWETLRRLQSAPRTSRVPVVMLTGNAMPEAIVRGYASGAVYYVAKPYRLDELVRGLRIAAGAPPAEVR